MKQQRCISEDELVQFLEGGLLKDEQERIRAHLSFCKGCRKKLHQYSELTRALRLPPPPEPPYPLVEKLKNIARTKALPLGRIEESASGRFYGGRYFVAAYAEKNYPLIIQSRGGKDAPWQKQVAREPLLISRVGQEVESGKEYFPDVQTPELPPFLVITDKSVYTTQDAIHLFAYEKEHHDAPHDVILRSEGMIIQMETPVFDEHGVWHKTLTGFERGTYDIEIEWLGEMIRVAQFTVTSYAFSSLEAVLTQAIPQEGKLVAQIFLNRYGAPFTGKVRTSFYCMNCDHEIQAADIVEETRHESEKRLTLKPNPSYEEHIVELAQLTMTRALLGHHGPFELKMLTDTGETASVRIPGLPRHRAVKDTRRREYGCTWKRAYQALYPEHLERSEPFSIFITDEKSLHIEVRERFSAVSVAVAEAAGKNPVVQTMQFNDVRRGTLLQLNNTFPKAHIFVGGIPFSVSEKPFESYIYLEKEEAVHFTCRYPEAVYPGENIKMSFTSSAPATCAIILTDSRLTSPLFGHERKTHKAPLQKRKPRKAPREHFPDSLGIHILPVPGTKEKRFRIGDQITSWKGVVLGFSKNRVVRKEVMIDTLPDFFVDIDVPMLASGEDEVICIAHYRTEDKAVLSIQAASEPLKERSVKAEGMFGWTLKGHGVFHASLSTEKRKDEIRKTVLPSDVMELTTSEFKIMRDGENGKAENSVAYPNVHALAEELTRALLRYPFDGAEPVSAKLAALSYSGHHARQTEDRHKVKALENQGQLLLDKLLLMRHKGGLFGWNEKEDSVELSELVAFRLALFLKNVPDAKAERLLRELLSAIKKETSSDSVVHHLLPGKVKINQKTSLSFFEALVLYHSGSDELKQNAETVLRRMAEGKGDVPASDERLPGGKDEAAAYALSVAQKQDTRAFEDKLMVLLSKIQDGMLSSPSSTLALIYLLEQLEDAEKAAAQAPRIVRVDAKQKLKLDEIKNTLKAGIHVNAKELKLGRIAKLTLNVKTQTLSQAVKIILPPNVSFVHGGANTQMIVQKITGDRLTFSVFCIRQGKGVLRALVYDLYDPNKKCLVKKEIIVE